MNVSPRVIAKGEAIVAEGRIRKVRKNRYMVTGESGRRYFVHNGKCRCLGTYYLNRREDDRVCSHSYAARLAKALGRG